MQLFELAARHRAWLAQSQSKVAENISNANTPGYAARHTGEFAALLESRPIRPSVTQPGHIAPAGGAADGLGETERAEDTESVTHSGNSVDLDSELMRAGEIRGGYALNTAIVKTFHRLLQASVRS